VPGTETSLTGWEPRVSLMRFRLSDPSGPRLMAVPPDSPCSHVQTLRRGRSKTPWQNDYLFISEMMAESVDACCPPDEGTPDPWSVSDPCPIPLGLNLD